MNDKKARSYNFKDSWQKNYDSIPVTLDKMASSKVVIKTHAIDRWNERVNRSNYTMTPQDIHRFICAHIRHTVNKTYYTKNADQYMKLWGPKNTIVTFDDDIVAVVKLRQMEGVYVLYVITVLGRISDNEAIGTANGVRLFLKNRLDVRFMDQHEIEGRLDVNRLGGIWDAQ